MNQQIKILHIDPEFAVSYFMFHSGSCSQFMVPIEEARKVFLLWSCLFCEGGFSDQVRVPPNSFL